MERSRAVIVALVVILLTAGCTPLPDPMDGQQQLFASPLGPAKTLVRHWFPLILKQPHAKKGLGLTYGRCGDVSTVNASWYYTWGPQPISCPGSQGVPMIRTNKATWDNVPPSSTWLMVLNEPDAVKQDNLTPSEAAYLWRAVELRFPRQRLVAPGVAWSGTGWLPQWRAEYVKAFNRSPRIDAIAFHCYLPTAAGCMAEVKYFDSLARAWNVSELWVTEYGFLPCRTLGFGAGDLSSALREAEIFTAWMDAQPRITRYAWFAARIRETESWSFPMGCSTALFDMLGTPTQFGEWYSGRGQ